MTIYKLGALQGERLSSRYWYGAQADRGLFFYKKQVSGFENKSVFGYCMGKF